VLLSFLKKKQYCSYSECKTCWKNTHWTKYQEEKDLEWNILQSSLFIKIVVGKIEVCIVTKKQARLKITSAILPVLIDFIVESNYENLQVSAVANANTPTWRNGAVDRAWRSLWKTSGRLSELGVIDVVKDCQSYFAIDLSSCDLKRRQDKFILRYISSSTVNGFCQFCNKLQYIISPW